MFLREYFYDLRMPRAVRDVDLAGHPQRMREPRRLAGLMSLKSVSGRCRRLCVRISHGDICPFLYGISTP